MSFWYGLGFDDMATMPIGAIGAYLDRLPARQAELKLILSDAASIPHMKNSASQSLKNGWLRTAMMNREIPAKPATPARLKMLGIGVRHV